LFLQEQIKDIIIMHYALEAKACRISMCAEDGKAPQFFSGFLFFVI